MEKLTKAMFLESCFVLFFLTQINCVKFRETDYNVLQVNFDVELKKISFIKSGSCSTFCSKGVRVPGVNKVERFDENSGKCECFYTSTTPLVDFEETPKQTRTKYTYHR